MSPRSGQRRGILLGVLAVLVAVGAFALFGGGDDADVSTVTETVTPTTPDKDKKKGKKDSKEADGAAAAGGPCTSTEQITKLRASGVSCGEASSVAKQWQRRQSQCNTVDNPSSPIGFERTCTVAGYKCTAKRDTSSDKRNVSCRKGSAQIRFTFLP